MKATELMIAISVVITSLRAQKLETQPLDTKKVVRVETARDHLTVIEMGDPVTMVAIGNQNAFTVERRENKVFVRPTDEEAKTNLFIWTAAGRYAYELVPSTKVEQMHFAIDHAPALATKAVPQSSVDRAAARSPELPFEMLTRSEPILLHGERDRAGRVEIVLRDLYQTEDRLYIRYAVLNHSAQPYRPVRPAAYRFGSVKSSFSLTPFTGWQLGERVTQNLKLDGLAQMEVLAAEHVPTVEPDGHGLGWFAAKVPKTEPAKLSVLRFEFASDAKGAVDAVLLVLRRSNRRPEAGHARPPGN